MSKKQNGLNFDFNKIVENIRQVIPNKVPTPNPASGDELGESLRKLSLVAADAAKQHAELTHKMYELENGFNVLFEQIKLIRGAEVPDDVLVDETIPDNSDQSNP